MQPNILIIMTDQESATRYLTDAELEKVLPAHFKLKQNGVSYENFYINSSPCTPSRSVLLTGLYSQQTWMCTNPSSGQPPLKTEFPTYARALREAGYDTFYSGKWHLSVIEEDNPYCLKDYGFDFFYPPHESVGLPNEGKKEDPYIAASAVNFIGSRTVDDAPFLHVVSFVNPHDIMFFPRLTTPKQPEVTNLPDESIKVPANFESMEHLLEEKPSCQAEYRRLMNRLLGKLPDDMDKPAERAKYKQFIKYYLYLEQLVDLEIMKVITALEENKAIINNTIVIFTSDHGEMAGSHGLRGKNYVAYEETVKVPFYIIDYTEKFVPASRRGTTREALGCSLDLFPTLLSVAASGAKSGESNTAAFMQGVDLTPNLVDPSRPTRDYVLFTHDDMLFSQIKAPGHILGLIEGDWKGAVYNNWRMDLTDNKHGSIEPDKAVEIVEAGAEMELYKRRTAADRLEVDNLAQDNNHSGIMNKMRDRLYRYSETEIRGLLPEPYQAASEEARKDFVDSQLSPGGGKRIKSPQKIDVRIFD